MFSYVPLFQTVSHGVNFSFLRFWPGGRSSDQFPTLRALRLLIRRDGARKIWNRPSIWQRLFLTTATIAPPWESSFVILMSSNEAPTCGFLQDKAQCWKAPRLSPKTSHPSMKRRLPAVNLDSTPAVVLSESSK